MRKPIDISVTISPRLPVWPGCPTVRFDRRLDRDRGDEVNDTNVFFSTHTGTHIDAPAHFLDQADTVEALPLEVLIGPVVVVDATGVETIDASFLSRIQLPAGTARLLFKTRNSKLWRDGVTEFQTDFVALSADAAAWVMEQGIRLVGIDYLSIQRYNDPPDTHLILLKAGVVIVEGLDLSRVVPGRYELCCLPMKLAGVEAAPARAVLLPPPPEAPETPPPDAPDPPD